MRRIAACALFLLCVAGQASAMAFRFNMPPGPYAVGFRLVEQYDASRSYGTAAGSRPVQTLVWYPAKTPGGAMRYEDYLELSASEEDFTLDAAQRRQRTDALLRQYGALGTDAAEREHIRNEPVAATRDAIVAQGQFPAVIYAPSDSSPAYENDSLCEYLASHGYVVIASPSHGAHFRYMTDGRIPYDLENTRAQAADIGFLIGYAQSLPQVDMGRVGVVAYSWGGMASMFAAIADSRIHALVDLDGSVRYFPRLLRAAPDVLPERLQAPLLFIADREDPIGPGHDSVPGSFIDRIEAADVTEVGLKRLFHQDLAAESLRLGSMAIHADTSVQMRNDSYGWVARYTLAFLDATLRHDAAASAFMTATPQANHVPPGTVEVWHRPARRALGSVEGFRAMLERSGYADAESAYGDYKRSHPVFRLDEDTLSAWLSSLLDRGRTDDAAAFVRVWTQVYPRSGDAWSQRGSIEEMAGARDTAMEDYRRALRFDPKNRIAREHLHVRATAAP